MKQFFKITKTKIIIFLGLLLLALIFIIATRFLSDIILNNTKTEKELIHVMENIIPVFMVAITALKYYLFVCLAVYAVKRFDSKDEKNI